MPSTVEILLTAEQRAQFVCVPPDLSNRQIARYYTFSANDLQAIARHRRPENQLGFAMQLAMLRFPGRTLAELPEVPERILACVAEQVRVPVAAFAAYGRRANTLYEHLDELRRTFGFRTCDWPALRCLARDLLPLALESDRPLPLIEKALTLLRADQIIAPGITTIERITWGVLQTVQRRLERWLTQPLSETHKTQVDGLLHADPDLRGRTRLSWLREAPEVASAKSLRKVLARRASVRALALPQIDSRVHPNRLRQLARRCARYATQPLAKFAPPRRHALLAAYLDDRGAELVDQALDLFDKLMGEVLRKGERKQEQHFQTHIRALNTNLSVLTTAGDAFLQAWRDGLEPFATVFGAVGGETTLTATVESSKRLVRPLDLPGPGCPRSHRDEVRPGARRAAGAVRGRRGAGRAGRRSSADGAGLRTRPR